MRGVGVDSAATFLIVAGDNPHRLASEGSFAALCGLGPVAASSGRTSRHRLNRGGNRHANPALFRAVLASLRRDLRTRVYLHRRTTEGLSRSSRRRQHLSLPFTSIGASRMAATAGAVPVASADQGREVFQ
ncbi:IS110 family transposase [Actinoplanes sp. NPDC051411]|uniref:IS110 family transposase n=1 Tax=Actinoplanes sp. NPDC051411 TaxID=3155522 RepID=UPI0034362150